MKSIELKLCAVYRTLSSIIGASEHCIEQCADSHFPNFLTSGVDKLRESGLLSSILLMFISGRARTNSKYCVTNRIISHLLKSNSSAHLAQRLTDPPLQCYRLDIRST